MKTSAERATDALNGFLANAVPGLGTEARRSVAAGAVRALLLAAIRLEYIGTRRTTTQGKFIHLLFDWLAHETGNDPELVKEGIKEKYGARADNPFGGGPIVKPTRRYDTEEITLLVEGCFAEAAEAGVDVTAFIVEWERIRRERDRAGGPSGRQVRTGRGPVRELQAAG